MPIFTEGSTRSPEEPISTLRSNDEDNLTSIQENDNCAPTPTPDEGCPKDKWLVSADMPYAEVTDPQPQRRLEGDLSARIEACRPWLLDVPLWLTYVPGDILYTDGIVKEENFNVSCLNFPKFYDFHSGLNYPAYTARSNDGHIGLVHRDYVSSPY